MPLLSRSSHPLSASIDAGKLEALTKRIQFGGDEVVKAKDGTGSATLSMAYAGAEFAIKVIKALAGEKGLVAPSYVHLDADKEGGAAVKKEIGKELDYFSTNVQIGVNEFLCLLRSDGPLLTQLLWQPYGVEKIIPLGNLSDYEKQLVAAAVPELATNIEKVCSSTGRSCLMPLAYSCFRAPRSRGPLLPKCRARMVRKVVLTGAC